MFLIRTEREFGRMCTSHGFSRLAPRFYARCVGDGIYQTIYTGFRKDLDIDPPNYSTEHKKSYYVSIGLRSIYSYHTEHVFVPGKDSGGYTPAELYKKCRYTGPFNGIEEDYFYMEQKGFDVLDTIDTQEKFLEWWDAVQVDDFGYRIHALQLVAPLLLCGHQHEAEHEISVSFIHGIDAYESYLEHVKSGVFCKDDSYEQRIWNSARKELNLWRWCIGRNQKELYNYINENYRRNMAWIEKYRIPTSNFTQQRSLETF